MVYTYISIYYLMCSLCTCIYELFLDMTDWRRQWRLWSDQWRSYLVMMQVYNLLTIKNVQKVGMHVRIHHSCFVLFPCLRAAYDLIFGLDWRGWVFPEPPPRRMLWPHHDVQLGAPTLHFQDICICVNFADGSVNALCSIWTVLSCLTCIHF